ncbi:MAG: response regulator [Verrucomicrobiales bacterium]
MADKAIILIVDDDEDDVLLLKTALGDAGINSNLRVVNDGEQAVSYLSGAGKYVNRQEYPLPTLVLLDLNMPKKSGFEVLEWIRQQPVLKRLPIVVLSSATQRPQINRAYELGANAYMAKITKFDDFVERIKILHRYWLQCTEKPELKDDTL